MILKLSAPVWLWNTTLLSVSAQAHTHGLLENASQKINIKPLVFMKYTVSRGLTEPTAWVLFLISVNWSYQQFFIEEKNWKGYFEGLFTLAKIEKNKQAIVRKAEGIRYSWKVGGDKLMFLVFIYFQYFMKQITLRLIAVC